MDRKWWNNSYIVEIKVKDTMKDPQWHLISERCNSLSVSKICTWEMLKDGSYPHEYLMICSFCCCWLLLYVVKTFLLKLICERQRALYGIKFDAL